MVLLKVTQVDVWAQVDLGPVHRAPRLWRLRPKTARVGSDFLRSSSGCFVCSGGLLSGGKGCAVWSGWQREGWGDEEGRGQVGVRPSERWRQWAGFQRLSRASGVGRPSLRWDAGRSGLPCCRGPGDIWSGV